MTPKKAATAAPTAEVSDADLRARSQRGDSPTAIARDLGVSRHTVVGRLTALGLKPARGSEAHDQAVAALRSAQAVVEADEARLEKSRAARVVAVAAARQAEVTWETIGACVKQAQPNAFKSFAPLIEEIHVTKVKVRKTPATKR